MQQHGDKDAAAKPPVVNRTLLHPGKPEHYPRPTAVAKTAGQSRDTAMPETR